MMDSESLPPTSDAKPAANASLKSSWHSPLNGIDLSKLDREGVVFFHLLLAGKPLSVSDLAASTHIPHQGICYHIQQLLNDGLIYCADQNGRTLKYSPQDYFKDSRTVLRLHDRLTQFTELLADQMDFGCVVTDEDDDLTIRARVEDALLANIRMFLSLFHSQGAIRLDPNKLRADLNGNKP